MDKKNIRDHAETMAWSWRSGEVLMVVNEVMKQPSKELATSLAVEIYSQLVSNNHKDDAVAFKYALSERAKAS